MADQPVTREKLINADIDVDNLGKAVNEETIVTPRYGDQYKSAPLAIKEIEENGIAAVAALNAKADQVVAQGFYKGYTTEALLLAAKPAVAEMRARADDTRKIYRWNRTSAEGVTPVTGNWVDTGLSELDQAKTYADTNKLDLSKIITEYVDGNKIGPKTPRYTNLGLSAGSILAQDTFDSLVLSVSDQDVLFIQNQQNIYTTSARIAFFAEDPNTNRTQLSIKHTVEVVQTPIQHWKVIAPTGAKYLMMNTRLYSGGVTTNFTWAVHKDDFSADYSTGSEVVFKINNALVSSPSEDYKKSVKYTDEKIGTLDLEKLTTSVKNLFTGAVRTSLRLSGAGTSLNNSIDNVISDFIPVEFGKTYTISGLNQNYINEIYRRINGHGANIDDSFVKNLTFTETKDGFTFAIDDAAIKYVLFPICSTTFGKNSVAVAQPIQFEVGSKATEYEPYKAPLSLLKTAKALKSEISKGLVNNKPMYINQFTELNKVRDAMSKVGVISKDMSPTGIVYAMQGLVSDENASNVVYTQYAASENGQKQIHVNLMKHVSGLPSLGILKSTAFNVPSGMLDNDGVATEYAKTYPKYDYCHPSIAYDATGVGGFKYWMIASILPGGVTTDATWEDEDLFVSNDAKNWQRVRSMYESDKTYTTATLRLPPQSIHTATERKHGFLPCPSLGETFEMSMPADNGAPAIDRQMITMNDRTPFKHDPFLMIDGGYVYTYHSFHMPYSGRPGGSNRFIVCVRTSDGINWDVVRTDGSTMRLTEETSRQIFTKDDQGRYNYVYYAYSRGYSNPEIIKWGDSDYEFFYGGNFSLKFKGTTPYSFDFSNPITVQDKGFGNHPGLLRDGNDLYVVGNVGFYKSTNRGVSFTKLTYYPFWLGGVMGIPYKKALCKGEGGKIIVADVERYFMPFYSIPSGAQVSSINRVNLLSLYEYSSLADLVVRANDGLVDAYLDFQLCKINYQTGMREFIALQSVSLKTITSNVNNPLSRFKLCDMSFNAGDNLHIYVTLNSRCGAKIEFGGIDIS